MNEPAGQQPYRAVLAVAPEPSLVKAFASPVKDCHAPPHNVRVNPLSPKTETKETGQCMKRRNKHNLGLVSQIHIFGIFDFFFGKKNNTEKSTLTAMHSGDLARLPLGQI